MKKKNQYMILCLFLSFQIVGFSFGQKVKTKADILISNCTLIDVINSRIVKNQDIIINKGKIIFVGDKTYNRKALKTIDGSHLIALPGFINTHTHLWQHIGKSMYPKESLQQWIKVYRTIHYLDSLELYKVVSAACGEALLSGITTISDYASLGFNDYAFESNANAIKNSGLSGVLVWNNPSIYIPDSIKISEIQRLTDKYKNQFSIWMGFGPFSFYSIPQAYSGILLAQHLDMNLTEHTMENMQEQRDFYDNLLAYRNKYVSLLESDDKDLFKKLLEMRRPSEIDSYERTIGDAARMLLFDSLLRDSKNAKRLQPEEKEFLSRSLKAPYISPVPLLEYFGALNKNFLAIHAVWPQKSDIDIFKKNQVAISHNPESNMYLSSGAAPMFEYFNSNLVVSLGTDGAASNDGINFFSAMKSTWNLYKLRASNVDVTSKFNAWQILQAATINGAKALHMEDQIGSIEVGKQANIVLISDKQLGLSPIRDSTIVPLIIYGADSRNVEYVLANGKILVSHSHLTKMDEGKLSSDLTAIAKNIDKKIVTGKTWKSDYSIEKNSFKDYWYKYRSIRIADSVSLNFTNRTDKKINFYVMSSGAVFGGGTTTVIAPEVKNRFPDSYPGSFSEMINLNPGESILITKPKNLYLIKISGQDKLITRNTNAGQLLVLAEEEK